MIYKDFDKTIKKMLIDKDMQLKQVAEELGDSQQNLNQKLKRESIRLIDAEKILNALGCKLIIVEK